MILAPGHPPAKLVPVLGRIGVGMGLEGDVGLDDVGHIAEGQSMALGPVLFIIGVISAPLFLPTLGGNVRSDIIDFVAQDGEKPDGF